MPPAGMIALSECFAVFQRTNGARLAINFVYTYIFHVSAIFLEEPGGPAQFTNIQAPFILDHQKIPRPRA